MFIEDDEDILNVFDFLRRHYVRADYFTALDVFL